MYRSNICKLIASPCMSICMGRKRHRKFHKGQSLACKTLFFLWGFVERKYPACSRAESANARVEKETKERVNWGCTAKSDWRQTGTSRGYFYDVTLQTWGWLWDAVAGKGRAPAIIVTSVEVCWEGGSMLSDTPPHHEYSSRFLRELSTKQMMTTCFITSTVWITARFPVSVMCRRNQIVLLDLLQSV